MPLLDTVEAIFSTGTSIISTISFLIILMMFCLLLFWSSMTLLLYILGIIYWNFDRHRIAIPNLLPVLIPEMNLQSAFKIIAVMTSACLTEILCSLLAVSKILCHLIAVALDNGDEEKEREELIKSMRNYEFQYVKSCCYYNCTECVICLDEFAERELCSAFPGCRHVFHVNCINRWLRNRISCPICRNSLKY